jgi:hypothetical protein
VRSAKVLGERKGDELLKRVAEEGRGRDAEVKVAVRSQGGLSESEFFSLMWLSPLVTDDRRMLAGVICEESLNEKRPGRVLTMIGVLGALHVSSEQVNKTLEVLSRSPDPEVAAVAAEARARLKVDDE